MRRTGKKHLEAFCERFERDRADAMTAERWGEWVDNLPRPEFFTMTDLYHPVRRASKSAPSKPTKKPRPEPNLRRSDDLCKELACIAAFNLNAAPAAQKKVYETIRTLQMLDLAAIEAGILPAVSNGECS